MQVINPREHASKTSKEKVAKYVNHANQVSGEVQTVRGWHDIGHNVVINEFVYVTSHIDQTFQVQKDIVSSSEYIRSGKTFNTTCNITKKLAFVSQRVNAVLKHGNPYHCLRALAMHNKLCATILSYSNLATADPLVYTMEQVFRPAYR